MNRNLLAVISIVFLIISCSNYKTERTTTENATPEVLVDKTDFNISYSSLSERYHENIIEQLYNEALKNNKELEKLNSQINLVTSDSLESKTNDYLKYRNTNINYWNTLDRYTENIHDSIVKHSITELFKNMKKDYENKVSDHEAKMKSIENLKLKLEDQKTVMKLLITKPMILNYQNNELPKIQQLESIIKDYQLLLEKTKEVIQKRTKK